MITNFVLQSAVSFPVALWADIPTTPGIIGCNGNQPFTLFLSAEDLNPHTIHLYAQNSRSAPYQQPQNKWSHLLAQWRFTDLSGNYIESIIPSVTSLVTDASGNTLGVIATAQFYYIDDRQSEGCSPVILWAIVDFSDYPVYLDTRDTLENVPGYANSKVGIVMPYFINGTDPLQFDITRNGKYPMFDLYWKDTNIPHVITVRGDTTYISAFCPDKISDSCAHILFDVPPTNYDGYLAGSLDRDLSVLPLSTNVVWTPETGWAYLSAYDNNGFDAQGWIRSSFSTEEVLLSTTITVSGNVSISKTWIHTPYYWISNPTNNTLNRLYYPCFDQTLVDQMTSYLKESKIIDISPAQTIYDVADLQVFTTNIMGLTGFGGIYGIAVDPCYNLWASDSENDMLYKFSTNGVLLSTIDFSDTSSFGTNLGGGTPAGISLDSDGYLWVSFFDSESAVKLNTLDGQICAVISFGFPDPVIDPLFSLYEEADPVYKPTLVETDMNNNVWVSYTNSLSSALWQFDSQGNYLQSITLPTCSNPMDIHIGRTNDVWVSLTYHAGPDYRKGSVNMYSSTTRALLCSISAVNPEYLAIDGGESVWFTEDWNTLTRVTTGGAKTSWTVGVTTIPDWADTEKLEYNALEGLCCDIYGRVFVINSIENVLYLVQDSSLEYFMEITPNNQYSFYNFPTTQYTVSGDSQSKSAQAFGDWCGYRFYRKYSPGVMLSAGSAGFSYIQGESRVFNVEDFTGLEIRKFNESWNASQYVHSLAIPSHINENIVLWDGYMDVVWGNDDTEYGKAFGRQSYERIANFTQNRADIEECNIGQVYDIASKVDVPIDDYQLSYPLELERIMDIISINQQKLWGGRCKCKQNYANSYNVIISGGERTPVLSECELCGHYHPGNRGNAFNPMFYMVTANVPFVTRDKYLSDKYNIIVPPISTVSDDTFNPCT